MPEVRARRLGRLSPQERVERLCDPGSFAREAATLASAHPEVPPGDGLVAGLGQVRGHTVAVIANDVRVMQGSMGARGTEVAAGLVRRATSRGCPVVWLIDSDGARVQEGAAAVRSSADLLAALADASGRVPLLAADMGLAGGVAAYGLALCDWAVAIANRSFLFVAGPAVVKAAIGEDAPLDRLGGTDLHLAAGTLSAAVQDDGQAIDWIRHVLGLLPSSSAQLPDRAPPVPPAQKGAPPLPGHRAAYQAEDVLACVVDAQTFVPLSASFGGSVQVGLGRLDGRAVGVVASHPRVLGGALDAESAQKVARFVRFCAAYNLPVLTLCDTPGFLPGSRQERARVLVHGAKVIAAYAEARQTVPVVTVVLRRAVGAGAVLAYGADPLLALPGAELVQMGSAAASAAYEGVAGDAHEAEAAGLVHRTVQPAEIRAELVRALVQARPAQPAPRGGRKAALVPL